ncbi:MAG: stage II sporulation protein P [Desulfurispora sp.]|uniref:stage II sporulation protein P n=1 Tax=Desulfurispora sp. TaxID=3014275 RepID=UPI00404AC7FD
MRILRSVVLASLPVLALALLVSGLVYQLWAGGEKPGLPLALFRSVMPGWLISSGEGEDEDIFSRDYAGPHIFLPLIGRGDFSIQEIIISELWPVSTGRLKPEPAGVIAEPDSGQNTGTDIVLPDTGALAVKKEDVRVAIYHTHTGETYRPDDGVERLNGQPGGVVAVGAALARRLHEEYGIGVVHVARINDAVYSRSYLESEKVVRSLLQNYPHLGVLVDVHRDAAGAAAASTVGIEGRKAARLLLVTGSDARAPFPGWRQNYQLALELVALAGKKYPGLLKGVQVKEGRYNQFLHPGAILLEVGNSGNSRAEAIYAGELFADILADYLQNNSKNRQ